MKLRNIILALLAAAPLLILVAWSADKTLQEFRDPCFQWGASQPVSLSLPPDGPCRSLRATAETKGGAVVRLILLNGGILIANLLGVLGALLTRPLLSVAGAGLIFLEAIPMVFSFGPLAVFASALFLMAARENTPAGGPARFWARAIGSLAGLGATLFLPGVLFGAPLSFLWVASLLFLAAVGWWPGPKLARSV